MPQNRMTIKEACLKALEDEKKTFTYREVYNKILAKGYYEWDREKALTPQDTVSAHLSELIRLKDNRVKRVKGKKGFEYYWAKYEDDLNIEAISEKISNIPTRADKYAERDLHILLSTYLRSINVLSKTIFHEKSLNSKDSNLNWIHPDMVGISFLELKEKSSQALLKHINKEATFNIYSYELKREINSDYELKQYFFQAVSNSTWANYGFLVVFDINGQKLVDELKRLSQAFGIGVIELKAEPHTSEVLSPAKYRDLEFNTLDKLSHANSDFKEFISRTNDILNAPDKYSNAARNEFINYCDGFLKEGEIQEYCEKHNIPLNITSIESSNGET